MPFGALDLLSVQLLAFALLASALQWPPLASRLVPRSAREEEAAEAARAEFHALEMSHTEGRKGVMLFVSAAERSEEHTSELQSLMRTSYAVFCLKKTKNQLYDNPTLIPKSYLSLTHKHTKQHL